MELLRRHDLVRLTAEGWRQAMRQHDDALVRQTLAHWSAKDLSVVVTTQGRGGLTGDALALGIATPPAWGLRRVSLRVAKTELRCGVAEFPRWNACADALPLPGPMRAALEIALGDHLALARLYGSFGWQQLTGLLYVKGSSDLDLLLEPADSSQADEMASALLAVKVARPPLDGEFCFADGSAVAWREWIEWRAGRVRSILVKRLDGPSLVSDSTWLAGAPAAAATA